LISRIRGKLISVSENRAEIKAGLITYEVLVPGYLETELKQELEQVIELFTLEYLENLASNQPVPKLVGFGSELEREFFEQLLKVPGIGIKTGLRAMKLSPGKMAEMIERGEAKFLAELPGLGRKSAERIVGEMKGKLERFITSASLPAMALGEDDMTAVSVLVNLGLRRSEAEELVKKARARGVSGSDELVQTALRERGRRGAEVIR